MRARLAVTLLTRAHALLLQLSGGRLKRSWLFAAGQPVLSLTTTGRKTGIARTTAVACFVWDEDLVIAGMNLGVERVPAWALNLAADPIATIELEGRRIRVLAERAQGPLRGRLWDRWLALQPSADVFRDLAGREIPLFILRPAVGPD